MQHAPKTDPCGTREAVSVVATLTNVTELVQTLRSGLPEIDELLCAH